jgi:hypothetical protein
MIDLERESDDGSELLALLPEARGGLSGQRTVSFSSLPVSVPTCCLQLGIQPSVEILLQRLLTPLPRVI